MMMICWTFVLLFHVCVVLVHGWKTGLELTPFDLQDILQKTILMKSEFPHKDYLSSSLISSKPSSSSSSSPSFSFKILNDLNQPDRQSVMIFADSQKVIISQLGTSFTNKYDIETNFRMICSSFVAGSGSMDCCKVHSGYLHKKNMVYPRVLKIIKEMSVRDWTRHDFYFVGHSQGAAVNLLMAMALIHDLGLDAAAHQIKIISFGSPKVISTDHINKVPIKNEDILRFESPDDFVTNMPPGPLFKHVGTLIVSQDTRKTSRNTRLSRLEAQVPVLLKASFPYLLLKGVNYVTEKYDQHNLKDYLLRSSESLNKFSKQGV